MELPTQTPGSQRPSVRGLIWPIPTNYKALAVSVLWRLPGTEHGKRLFSFWLFLPPSYWSPSQCYPCSPHEISWQSILFSLPDPHFSILFGPVFSTHPPASCKDLLKVSPLRWGPGIMQPLSGSSSHIRIPNLSLSPATWRSSRQAWWPKTELLLPQGHLPLPVRLLLLWLLWPLCNCLLSFFQSASVGVPILCQTLD